MHEAIDGMGNGSSVPKSGIAKAALGCRRQHERDVDAGTSRPIQRLENGVAARCRCGARRAELAAICRTKWFGRCACAHRTAHRSGAGGDVETGDPGPGTRTRSGAKGSAIRHASTRPVARIQDRGTRGWFGRCATHDLQSPDRLADGPAGSARPRSAWTAGAGPRTAGYIRPFHSATHRLAGARDDGPNSFRGDAHAEAKGADAMRHGRTRK